MTDYRSIFTTKKAGGPNIPELSRVQDKVAQQIIEQLEGGMGYDN
jgi:hypothetical protein